MPRTLLLIALFGTVVGEFAFAGAGLFAPEWTLGQFRVVPTTDTLFLSFGLAWLVLGVACVCALGLLQLLRRAPGGHALVRVLGLWWVAVGIAIYLKSGRTENLVLDSAKGALLVGLSLWADVYERRLGGVS